MNNKWTKSFWVFLVGSFFLISCSDHENNQESGEFRIKGQLLGKPGEVLYLERFGGGGELLVDSCEMDASGKFELNGYTDSPDIFVLYTNPNNYTYLLIDEKEEVELTGNIENLDLGLSIDGSPGSLQLLRLKTRHKHLQDKLDSLQRELLSKRDTLKEVILNEADASVQAHVSFLKQFVDSNPHSLASIAALFQKIGQHRLISYEEDLDYFKKVDETLTQLYPHNYHVKDFHSKYLKMHEQYRFEQINASMIGIGSTAPDIDYPGPNGENFRLSDLRGKYILIDFWASWCSPCRRESPYLVRAYQEFNSKGFEIFQVSLDKHHDQWVQAINEDGLAWPYHVSDLKYWDSEPAERYKVSSIPTNFLIDPQGKVIDKNLRGETLLRKLDELLNP